MLRPTGQALRLSPPMMHASCGACTPLSSFPSYLFTIEHVSLSFSFTSPFSLARPWPSHDLARCGIVPNPTAHEQPYIVARRLVEELKRTRASSLILVLWGRAAWQQRGRRSSCRGDGDPDSTTAASQASRAVVNRRRRRVASCYGAMASRTTTSGSSPAGDASMPFFGCYN